MTLTLSPELERRVEALIAQGAYPNADALVAEALESLMRQREEQSRWEALLVEAEASGPYEPMNDQDWVEIHREGIDLARARGVV